MAYVDENNHDLAPVILKLDNSGEPYTTEQKTFPGYTLKYIHGDATGKYGLVNETTPVVYIYTANPQAVRYNVIDDTDKKNLVSNALFDEGVTAGNLTKTKADLQTIANEFAKQGYVVASVDDVPTTFNDGTTPQVVNIHLTHRVTTVTPDEPKTPGQPVNPDNPDGPKWQPGVAETDLKKTVNETIHYEYAIGGTAAADKTDKVSFSRTATVDLATGKVIAYGEWTADDNDTTFDAKESPVVAGYTPKYAQIDAITVNANTADVVRTVTYTADDQKAVVNFVDQTDGKTLTSEPLTGKTNTNSDYTPAKTIADYESKGYEFVSNDFPENGLVFDTDDTKDQVYTVVLKHKMTPVAPDKPEKPGQPVMPSNPEGPKWPTENDLNKTVTEKINYVYEDGTKAATDVTDAVEFTRTATVDEVTGEVTYSDWVAKDNDTTFDAVKSPVIVGYQPDHAQIDAIPVDANTTDVVKTVTYKADKQSVVYNVIDDTTGEKLEDSVAFDSGETKAALNKSQSDLEAIADAYAKRGYEIFSVDPVPGAFDNDDKTDQVVNIHLKHVTKTVTPEKPGTPGAPIDPSNPNGPKWSDGVSETDLKKTVKETVHYVFSDGSVAAPDATDAVEFTRTATVDEVTGKVIAYGEWTATDGDTTFDAKVSPVIAEYFADKANIAEVDNLTPASTDVEEKVTYTKLGSYLPELPDGTTPSKPYPNDPTDPSKPGTNVPAMPYVPGYTPEGPDGHPLTPIDPDNPSKGYNPPAVPDDPTTDTVVKYDGDDQNVVYNVIDDTTGKKLEDNIAFDSGKTKAALNKSQSDLQAIADGYVKRGYEIVSVDPVPDAFDDDDKTAQVVNIHLKHVTNTVTPETPGTPGAPIDPSNPDGPKWPAGTDKNSVDAVVKETVHYVYKDGSKAADDASDAVEFTRTATVDEVTGEVSPVITGYTPSDAQINVIPVTAETGDVSRTVTYKADKQKAVVNFIDQDTGEILKTQSLQGVTNGHETYTPAKDIADFERVVYDLFSNDYPIDGFQYDSDDTNVQEFSVILKHKTATVVVPNEPIHVATSMVPNEPIRVATSMVPNEPITAPTSGATGDYTVQVQKVTTNELTKQKAAGDTTVVTRTSDHANAESSVAASNTVSLPDTAAKGDQDKNGLLVAFAMVASLLTFGFVQKRK